VISAIRLGCNGIRDRIAIKGSKLALPSARGRAGSAHAQERCYAFHAQKKAEGGMRMISTNSFILLLLAKGVKVGNLHIFSLLHK
jgi:hypothetical protein